MYRDEALERWGKYYSEPEKYVGFTYKWKGWNVHSQEELEGEIVEKWRLMKEQLSQIGVWDEKKNQPRIKLDLFEMSVDDILKIVTKHSK